VLNLPTKDSGQQGTTMLAAASKTKAHQSTKTAAANIQEKRVNARAGKLVVASWYGAKHAGKTMANGRPFNMYADTAAHKTLPLGTKLRLTNPANGRTATVDELIDEYGPSAPAVDFSQAMASEALSRVIEVVMDEHEDPPTLGEVHEAMIAGLVNRLVGDGVIEEDEDDTLETEIEGLIGRFGVDALAEDFLRYE